MTEIEIDRLRSRLRVCEQQLAISMDHAPIGMSIVDNDNRMVRVNAALCRFLGYSEAQLHGFDWRELTHPEDLTIGAAEIAELFAGERSSFAVEKRYLRVDGQPVWAQVNVALLREEDGTPLFRLTQHVDISERKEREHHLAQVADTQRAVSEELRRLDEMKNDFLDAVSHELRTPLTVILGVADTLRSQRENLDHEARTRLEDALAHQAHRLGDLLEGLTELKRLSQGQAIFEPGLVDAVDVTRRVVEASAAASRTRLDAPNSLLVRTENSRPSSS